MSILPEKRRICADTALNCFGTAYIFEHRARNIRRRVRGVAFLGIAGPVALGGTIALVGTKSPYAEKAIYVGGLIGIVQVLFSVWSLVSNWDIDLAYALESKSDNYRLADEFNRLGQTTSLQAGEFEMELKILETQGELRTKLDDRVDLEEKEKRMGMCAGLRHFRRACVTCKNVPISLKPTPCDTCGNF